MRIERDISLDELAAATGVGWTTIHRLERGRGTRDRPQWVTLRTVARLAYALGVQPSELMP